MDWYFYVILGVLFVIGILLLPPKHRDIVLHIILFPVAWVLAILTFPVHYFKQMFYTKPVHKPELHAIKISDKEDFMIKMVKKNGEEVIIKPFEEENKDVSISKK